MIKFYTNRELAQKFHINLARWKRWSREFLPPDPLGGLQTGYARQYNPNEAFILYLAGHLVGEMKFSITEVRRILSTVHPWLAEHGFLFDFSGGVNSANKDPQSTALFSAYQLIVIPGKQCIGKEASVICLARGVEIAGDRPDSKGRRQCYVELPVGTGANEFRLEDITSYRVLNISVLRRNFLNALKEVPCA